MIRGLISSKTKSQLKIRLAYLEPYKNKLRGNKREKYKKLRKLKALEILVKWGSQRDFL